MSPPNRVSECRIEECRILTSGCTAPKVEQVGHTTVVVREKSGDSLQEHQRDHASGSAPIDGQYPGASRRRHELEHRIVRSRAEDTVGHAKGVFIRWDGLPKRLYACVAKGMATIQGPVGPPQETGQARRLTLNFRERASKREEVLSVRCDRALREALGHDLLEYGAELFLHIRDELVPDISIPSILADDELDTAGEQRFVGAFRSESCSLSATRLR